MTHQDDTRYCRKCDRRLPYGDFDVFVQSSGKRLGRKCRHSFCRTCRERVAAERSDRKRLPVNTAVLCLCGCGKPTPVSSKTSVARGTRRGAPIAYIAGHRAFEPGIAYVVESESGCWLWQKGTNAFGYGICSSGLAHRVLYEMRVGAVPSGHDLHHRCEVRSCVNPDHVVPWEHAAHIRAHKAQVARSGISDR